MLPTGTGGRGIRRPVNTTLDVLCEAISPEASDPSEVHYVQATGPNRPSIVVNS